MNIDNLLKDIEKRPELFTGCRDIDDLGHFLRGYIFCAMQNNLTPVLYKGEKFENFAEFLSRKYADKRSYGEIAFIKEHEEDGNTVDAYFRLLKEYGDYLENKKENIRQ